MWGGKKSGTLWVLVVWGGRARHTEGHISNEEPSWHSAWLAVALLAFSRSMLYRPEMLASFRARRVAMPATSSLPWSRPGKHLHCYWDGAVT